MSIPPEVRLAALAAVEKIPCTCGKGHGTHPAWCAKNLPSKIIDAALEAAEAVWPHEPSGQQGRGRA